MKDKNFRIPFDSDQSINVESSKICRGNFISFTHKGKKYTVDAVFDLEDIPKEVYSNVIEIIFQMRGCNISGFEQFSNTLPFKKSTPNKDEGKSTFWNRLKSLFKKQ